MPTNIIPKDRIIRHTPISSGNQQILNLKQIENRNIYNIDKSIHNTTNTQINENKGLISAIFVVISLPFRIIGKIFSSVDKKYDINQKYKNYALKNKKAKKIAKFFRKTKHLYNLDEII